MFKKRAKKDQGVLLIEDQAEQQLQQKQSTQKQLNPVNSSSNSQQQMPAGHNIHEIYDHTSSVNQAIAHSKENRGVRHQGNYKRSKNQEDMYVQDSEENMDNEPRRKEKQGFGPQKTKIGISNNTMVRNEQTSKQVHDAFRDIGYQAGNSLIKDMDLPQEELQEEAAKRRYMENIEKTKLIKDGKMSSKVYRGMNAYANHKLTENDIKNAEEAYKKKMGPSRLNSTIKNSCRFDYVQNLCKDWHDSGYCPFGNSCLYLHDRSNYKTGWELQKDFEEQERERWKRINNPDIARKQDKQKLLKTIEKHHPPSRCQVCQQKFKNPVEVECGHIFCTSCAIKLLKCKTCNKKLSGIMNNAAEKLATMSKNYDDMVLKLQAEQEETQTKRRKFQNVSSLDVFAD